MKSSIEKLRTLKVGDRIIVQTQPEIWASEFSRNCPVLCGMHLDPDDFPIVAEVVKYSPDERGYYPAGLHLERFNKTYGFDMYYTVWEHCESETESLPETSTYIREHLEQWISEELKENEISMDDALRALHRTFGEDIYYQIDGFIQFIETNPDMVSDEEIKVTLLHDITGAMREDKLMLPRVSDYGEYSII